MYTYSCLTFLLWIRIVSAYDDDDSLSRMAKSNDEFSAKMLWQKVKGNSHSAVISGYSVITPLSLLTLAAVGVTHTELLSTLGFENDNIMLKANSDANSKLTETEGIEIKMANRIYLPNDVELSEDFAEQSKEIGTEVKNMDFNEADAAETINKWVAKQTNNKIQDLISKDDVNSNTQALLVNALYFKGQWFKPFEGNDTYSGTFHKTREGDLWKDEEESTSKVKFMFQEDYFGYHESDELDAQILEMRYKADASFIIMLPKRIGDLESLVEKIKFPTILRSALKKTTHNRVKVKVTIPKFTIDTQTNLKEILQKMGVKKIFTPLAKLPKIIKEAEKNEHDDSEIFRRWLDDDDDDLPNSKKSTNLYFTQAVQRAFISVSEAGTEAAAANKIVSLSLPMPMEPKIFKANHPFAFLLKCHDLILFGGVYRGD